MREETTEAAVLVRLARLSLSAYPEKG